MTIGDNGCSTCHAVANAITVTNGDQPICDNGAIRDRFLSEAAAVANVANAARTKGETNRRQDAYRLKLDG